MTTEPLGYLIAIWVALEDVTPDSGPVYYYPGSHRIIIRVTASPLGLLLRTASLPSGQDSLTCCRPRPVLSQGGQSSSP